jgi:hypothetical protein
MNINIGLALSGAGTVLLALIFFYFPWQSFVVDQTRQRLFEIRDKWFDYSHDRLFCSTDKLAAAAIRAELNHMIRFVHHFTLPVIAYLSVIQLFLKITIEGSEELNEYLGKFQSPEARKEAKKVLMTAIIQIAWCMGRRSLVMLVATPFIMIGIILVSGTIGSAIQCSRLVEKLIATLAIKGNSRLVPRC